MIKHTLLAAALLLSPVLLFAQAADRDMLATPDGVVYTIESDFAYSHPEVQSSASRFLTLTVQDNGNRTVSAIPATLSDGAHLSPALTYDPDSQTLFVLWQKNPNPMISELYLCSYQKGKWSAPIAVDNVSTGSLRHRMNLRLGVTHSVAESNADGSVSQQPALTLHAIWWDQVGRSESARYAMIATEKGAVTDITVRDLGTYLDSHTSSNPVTALDAGKQEILRHPALFEASNHNSIDVVFADWETARFHRVSLHPVANGRLRVPVGRQVGPDFGPSKVVDASVTGKVTILQSPDTTKLLFYFQGKDALQYFVAEGDTWAAVKSISTDQRISVDFAAETLRRMINSQ